MKNNKKNNHEYRNLKKAVKKLHREIYLDNLEVDIPLGTLKDLLNEQIEIAISELEKDPNYDYEFTSAEMYELLIEIYGMEVI